MPHNYALILPRKPQLSSKMKLHNLPTDVGEVFLWKGSFPPVGSAGSLARSLSRGQLSVARTVKRPVSAGRRQRRKTTKDQTRNWAGAMKAGLASP